MRGHRAMIASVALTIDEPPPPSPNAVLPNPTPKLLPTVLLRHTLPDGTHHFDWLLARCDLDEAETSPEVRDVVTLRLDASPNGASANSVFDAQQLPDHRRHYLTHEGEVPPPEPGAPLRGSVERIAAGLWRPSDTSQPLADFLVAFAGQPPRRWSFNGSHVRPL